MTSTEMFKSLLMLAFLGACAATPPGADQKVASAQATPKPQMKAEAEKQAEAAGQDRQSGYYYPPLTSTETYKARSKTLKNVNRNTRLGFVTAITKRQLDQNYAPKTSIFAKGDKADKLIIVALEAGAISTVYQGRAMLAQLTATSRLSPLFKELGVQGFFTFFDLAKLLGFKTITVSDGVNWSHRIDIE